MYVFIRPAIDKSIVLFLHKKANFCCTPSTLVPLGRINFADLLYLRQGTLKIVTYKVFG